MQKLTTLEKVKQYLSIVGNNDDDLLEQLIDNASAFLLTAMDRQKGLNYPYKYCKRLYDEVPEDVMIACHELIGLKYKERLKLGEKTISLAGQNITYNFSDISPFVELVRNTYKRVVPSYD